MLCTMQRIKCGLKRGSVFSKKEYYKSFKFEIIYYSDNSICTYNHTEAGNNLAESNMFLQSQEMLSPTSVHILYVNPFVPTQTPEED